MTKTPDGKWVVFDVSTGQQLERWPVDAKLLVNNETHSFEPPEGVEAVVAPPPPKRVGVPKAQVAKTFVNADK